MNSTPQNQSDLNAVVPSVASDGTVMVSDPKAGIQTIGIIGAGQMGQGIVEFFWLKGYNVLVYDSNASTLERAHKALLVRLDKAIAKGNAQADQRSTLISKLSLCCKLSDFASCDLVIEAIIENHDVKAALYGEVAQILQPSAILATNTSSLSITKLANEVEQSAQFLGIHFFNPAHHMPLVEVVPHTGTSPAVIQLICEVLTAAGKMPIVCADSPGFIVNRLLLPMINLAAKLVDDNIASAKDIDAAMKLGANFPMGPLALADFIGLDVVVYILNILAADLNDATYAPVSGLLERVKAGNLGIKTGHGFYDYATPKV
jgi:3-hydroxybutyryl-CoA dehydrogenase